MKRHLPECCYDFRVFDVRVNDVWGPFDTHEEARREFLALPVPQYRERRYTYEIRWTVNEKKVLAFIKSRETSADLRAAWERAEKAEKRTKKLETAVRRIIALVGDP